MYEARRRSTDLGLTEHELVVTRAELDALTDQIWLLGQLTDDILRAAPGQLDDREHRELLEGYLVSIRALLAQDGDASQNAGNPRSVKLDRESKISS
jgi:hypothetical protein